MKKVRTSLGVCTIVLSFMLTTLPVPLTAQDWPMFGQNVSNTAATTGTDLSTMNVYKLKPKWVFTTGGDVSARAAVVNKVAYFPDWGGYLWAVNTTNGKAVWGHQLSDYGLPANTVSRTTPALDDAGSTVYLGTQATPTGAYLLAINAKTGALNWKVVLDSDPYAIDTTSPAIYNGFVYTGVASVIEGATAYGFSIASDPNARGSVVAVNLKTHLSSEDLYRAAGLLVWWWFWGSNRS